MKKIMILFIAVATGIATISCNNDSTAKSYPYNVRMTDAPGPYQKVNIDLQAVEVTGNSVPCGHYIAEEVPELLTSQALNFFNQKEKHHE